jgi:hypothetical protein
MACLSFLAGMVVGGALFALGGALVAPPAPPPPVASAVWLL